MTNAVQDTIRAYILQEFLAGEDPDTLEPTTPLISGGIIDSIAMLQLVTFLEEQFGVGVEAHEMNADHLDTVAAIANFVAKRQPSRG